MIVLGAAVLAVLAIVALVWLLNRDGDEGTSPPPTATIESVIDAAPPTSEPEDDPSTLPGFLPPVDETPEPTPTEAVRRGGDNQLGRDDPGTPGASGTDGSSALRTNTVGIW